jgi:site-specific DNA recombinase
MGIRVISLKEAIDRDTPEGRLQTGILAEFAEFELAKIRARTAAGISARARKGKPWGSPPFGYRRGEDGDWEPNAAEVPIAMRIWDERVKEGRAYQDIAVRLNRDGIPGRTGGNWTATMVRKILSARYMLGYFEHNGEWIKGRHPVLIDEDTWLAARVLAQQGSKYAPSRGGRRPKLHLCTGATLRCSVCHEAMLPRSDRDWYECRTNKQLKGKGSCPMPAQDRATVDVNVVHAVEELFIDLDATKNRVAGDLDAHLAQTEDEAQRAEGERAQKAAALDRVESDYLAGELGGANYERLSTRLSEELSALDAQCERLARHAEGIRHSRLKLDVDQEVFNRLAELRASVFSTVRSAQEQQDIDAMRAAIRQAVDAVYIGIDGAVSFELTDTLAKPGDLKVPLPLRTLHGSGVPE